MPLRVLLRLAVVLVPLVFAVLIATARAEAAGNQITQFYVGGIPADITAGADGNLWFTDNISNEIVKMTPAGAITRYPIPTFFSSPSSITAGPDGNVWFAEVNGNKIGRITPAGVITEFPVPTPVAGLYGGITAGADGNVWFAEGNSGKLGRITPDGVITEFPGIGAYDVASGPDGNLWTVNPFSTAIGRVTTSGAATFFFPPVSGGTGGAITGGPDGKIWFTYIASGQGQVGVMTTSGTFVAGYPIPTPNTSALAVAAGPDGNVWFGEWDQAKIGRITPAGVITEYPVNGARISGITSGPGGNVWFASRDGWVGHIQLETDTTPPTIIAPNDVTVNATSPNGATVNYEVTASDDSDPHPTVVCNPPSGSTFVVGTTEVDCTATDASGNQATASFMVHVRGAGDQLADLYNTVLGVGPGTSLSDKVRQAQSYLAAQDITDACETLDSFIRQVRALSGRTIPAAAATSLIADATRIENVMGC
jgi:virginiamycin B lyase